MSHRCFPGLENFRRLFLGTISFSLIGLETRHLFITQSINKPVWTRRYLQDT